MNDIVTLGAVDGLVAVFITRHRFLLTPPTGFRRVAPLHCDPARLPGRCRRGTAGAPPPSFCAGWQPYAGPCAWRNRLATPLAMSAKAPVEYRLYHVKKREKCLRRCAHRVARGPQRVQRRGGAAANWRIVSKTRPIQMGNPGESPRSKWFCVKSLITCR